jgi:hypothetical protein
MKASQDEAVGEQHILNFSGWISSLFRKIFRSGVTDDRGSMDTSPNITQGSIARSATCST